jgi:hypothetical protein
MQTYKFLCYIYNCFSGIRLEGLKKTAKKTSKKKSLESSTA